MDGQPPWEQRYREYLLLEQGSDDPNVRNAFERIGDHWRNLADHVATMFLRR